MALKHKVTINITDSNGDKATVLKGADLRLPSRIIKFLFGDFKQIYLLDVGQSVESVDVNEVKGEIQCERNNQGNQRTAKLCKQA